MTAALLPSTTAPAGQLGNRSCSGASCSRPTVAFWQPRMAPNMRRGRFASPQAYGRNGYWGPCGPGMMGSSGMAGYMNKPLSEILQQLEREFGSAAEQAREAQRKGADHSRSSQANNARGMSLPLDTIETDEAVWYFADIPGLEKRELQIQANQQNRTISISGERTQPLVGEDEQKQTRDMQRRFGKFSHTIVLPKNADPQLISAKVDKGVLRIKVLKSTEAEPGLQNVPID